MDDLDPAGETITPLDYQVLDLDVCEVRKDGTVTGYILTGPRGARYRLMRNVPNPHLLFACNDRPGRFGPCRVRGSEWFSDQDGTLRALR